MVVSKLGKPLAPNDESVDDADCEKGENSSMKVDVLVPNLDCIEE